MNDLPNNVFVTEQAPNQVVVEQNNTEVTVVNETTLVVKVDSNAAAATRFSELLDVDMNSRDDGSLPEYDAGQDKLVLRRDLRQTILDGGNF